MITREAALEACSLDETPAGRRDAAIIALLFGAGAATFGGCFS
jgi:hypothetical protein